MPLKVALCVSGCMSSTEAELEQLLEQICVELGFCLSHKVKCRLIKFPPKTSEKFTQSVIKAEGLNVDTLDKSLYKSLFVKIDNVYSKYT